MVRARNACVKKPCAADSKGSPGAPCLPVTASLLCGPAEPSHLYIHAVAFSCVQSRAYRSVWRLSWRSSQRTFNHLKWCASPLRIKSPNRLIAVAAGGDCVSALPVNSVFRRQPGLVYYWDSVKGAANHYKIYSKCVCVYRYIHTSWEDAHSLGIYAFCCRPIKYFLFVHWLSPNFIPTIYCDRI